MWIGTLIYIPVLNQNVLFLLQTLFNYYENLYQYKETKPCRNLDVGPVMFWPVYPTYRVGLVKMSTDMAQKSLLTLEKI